MPKIIIAELNDLTNKMLRAWMPMNNYTNKSLAAAEIIKRYLEGKK